jgi:hypothetical protein
MRHHMMLLPCSAVKLAAANPLMALVNDVAGLLRLVDKTAGRYLTCLTKSTSTAAAAAAAAGGGSSSSHSLHAAPRPNAELHQRLAAMTSRPPFSEGPSWHVLQVPVHAELLPVYVLGNGISDAAMNRGLNSLVSSSTLRLLSKSPAALVAAIRVQQAQPAGAQQQQHHAGHSEEQATASDQSNSSSSSSGAVVAGSSLMSLNSSRSSSMCWSGGADFDEFSSSTAWAGDAGTPRSLSRCSSLEATLHQKQQLVDATDDEEMEEKGAADEAELSTVSASAGVAAQLSGCGAGQAAGPQLVAALQTRSESLSSARARIRTQLHLTAEQQQKLARHINLRLTTLQERCKIYSLYKQD